MRRVSPVQDWWLSAVMNLYRFRSSRWWPYIILQIPLPEYVAFCRQHLSQTKTYNKYQMSLHSLHRDDSTKGEDIRLIHNKLLLSQEVSINVKLINTEWYPPSSQTWPRTELETATVKAVIQIIRDLNPATGKVPLQKDIKVMCKYCFLKCTLLDLRN